jgi:hypothetical protein
VSTAQIYPLDIPSPLHHKHINIEKRVITASLKTKVYHHWTHSEPAKSNQHYILSLYGSTALVDLGRFPSFLIHTQSVGLLARGISPSQGRYLHTEHKYRINAHRHPCLQWDSNQRTQCPSGRKLFMPQTARPL